MAVLFLNHSRCLLSLGLIIPFNSYTFLAFSLPSIDLLNVFIRAHVRVSPERSVLKLKVFIFNLSNFSLLYLSIQHTYISCVTF